MKDYSDIKQSIATNLPDNNRREITAAKLRSTLNEFVDKVETTETGLEQKCEVLNNIDDEPTVGSNNLVKSGGVYPTKEAVDNTTYKHNNLVDLNDIVSGEWISPTYGTIIQNNNSYHTNKIPVKAGQVLWFTGGEKLVCYNNGIQYKGSPSS